MHSFFLLADSDKFAFRKIIHVSLPLSPLGDCGPEGQGRARPRRGVQGGEDGEYHAGLEGLHQPARDDLHAHKEEPGKKKKKRRQEGRWRTHLKLKHRRKFLMANLG